jgi:SAM-dependent methyltransferase
MFAMDNERIRQLTAPIEQGVVEHGAVPRGVWLDRQDSGNKLLRRFEAHLRMAEGHDHFSILDIGCGPGLLIDYLEDRLPGRVADYLGIDVSEPLVAHAKRRWPEHAFEVRDIAIDPIPDLAFDYAVICGIFTPKFTLPYADFEAFVQELLSTAWRSTRVALSFNVMSPHVDWTREDLFHWPMDNAAGFCIKNLSRHVNVIADYGLYEYTVQVFREPHAIAGGPPAGWDRG